MSRLVRRTFTLVALAALVAACSGGGGPTPPPQQPPPPPPPPPGGNLAPIVSAGADQSAWRGYPVQLQGDAFDPEGAAISISWTQTAGPAVVLSSPTSEWTSFTTPAVPCDLEFMLSASDASQTKTDRVVVHVLNRTPTFSSVSISPAGARTLDDLTASATTTDPDGDAVTLTYAWARNGVTIAGRTGATLPASETTKNDLIRVTVTANDGYGTSTGTASLTIQDTPPSFTVNPPSTVTHGVAVSFPIVAVDPDGDLVGGFSVAYGPAGFAVAADGTVTWPAALPMLDDRLDVRWGIRVAGFAGTALEGVFHVVDPDHVQPLRRTGLEIPVSHSGLQATDLDGDGDVELLVASPYGVYELAKSGTGYAQVWMYPFDPDGGSIGAAFAADVDGIAGKEIFFSDGELVVKLDGATRREVARVDAPGGSHCLDLEVADLDGDATAEVACLAVSGDYYSTEGTVLVLDATTLAVEWQTSPLATGRALAVGNVDGDAALEIVTSGGYVFDGATHGNEWASPVVFGDVVDTGDLDGNGVEEIVATLAWDSLRAFTAAGPDPTSKGLLWEVPKSDTAAVLAANLDADTRAELVVGDGQWGNVTVYDPVSATSAPPALWSMSSQKSSVSSIAAGDVDGDGKVELVWGTGSGSTGEDSMVVASRNATTATGVLEWMNTGPAQLDPPFVGGALARLGGGKTALLFGVGRTDSGYKDGRLVALDPATGLWSTSPEVSIYGNGIGTLEAGDCDGDGVDEALFATLSLKQYDFSRSVLEWQSPADVLLGAGIAQADLTGDGFPDVVVVNNQGYVHAYDVKRQILLWKSAAPVGGYGVDVAVADVDGDGEKEIVAATTGRVVVLGPDAVAGYAEEASLAFTDDVADLLVATLPGASLPAILVLEKPYSAPANLLRLDGALAPLGSVTLDKDAATIALEDLPGARNVVVGYAYSYTAKAVPPMRAVDAVNGAEIWRAPPLWGEPQRNSVHYADANGDGARDLAIATRYGMYLTR